MATYTSRLNLKKPAGNENINISDINGNMDILDNKYWDLFQYKGDLTSANFMSNLEGVGLWRITSTQPSDAPDNVTWSFVIQLVYGTLTQQIIIRTGGTIWLREYIGSPQAWTSWKQVSGKQPVTRINYGSNSYVEYWRSGETGIVKIVYNVADGTIGSWTTKEIATIPAGFRPVQAITIRGCVDRSGDEGTCMTIDSSGSVKVQTRFNSFDTAGDILQGTITFPIAN